MLKRGKAALPARMSVTVDAEQFDALAELLALREGRPAREAARLVLVDGLAPSAAADLTGLSRPSVSNALARCRRGIELSHRVAGIK